MDFFSDLAIDEHERIVKSLKKENGYSVKEEKNGFITVSRMKVLNEEGEKAVNRIKGNYVTLTLDDYSIPEESYENSVNIIADEILKTAKLKESDSVLVVGLGNDLITPDSLGPSVARKTVSTRHLLNKTPSVCFGEKLREVSVIIPGVLGQTGIESFEITQSIVQKIKPDAVLLIDSLAAKGLERLAKAIQISDSGLVPGGGVGNSRAEISEKTLGAKCISIGVPTVVSAESLTQDIVSKYIKKNGIKGLDVKEMTENTLSPFEAGMIITPKDISQIIREFSRLLGFAVNSALHFGMKISNASDWLKY